jgi:hypothetical protein
MGVKNKPLMSWEKVLFQMQEEAKQKRKYDTIILDFFFYLGWSFSIILIPLTLLFVGVLSFLISVFLLLLYLLVILRIEETMYYRKKRGLK